MNTRDVLVSRRRTRVIAAVMGTCLMAAGCADTAAGGGKTATPDAEPPDAAVSDAQLPSPPLDATAHDDGGPAGDDAARGDAQADAEEPPPPDPDAARPGKPDAAPPPAPRIGFVEVSLTPRQGLYAPAVPPVAEATVRGRDGAPLPEVPVTWRLEPAALGSIDAAGVLAFTGEGPGTVVACTAEPDVICGRAHLYVDAGLPTLEVLSPDRGAALGGDRTETIAVRGRAADTGGTVTVRVNGVPVGVGPDGAFALDVPATFGINHLEVTADDGVQPQSVRVTRDVLWAPEYLRVEADGALVPDAARLWLGQALLDLDQPAVIPDVAGPWAVDDLATLLAGLLGTADANALLGGVDAGGLTIRRVVLGVPEVDLFVVPAGLELFLRLGGLHLDVEGAFDFEGARLDLTGGLDASLAAFASLTFAIADDGGLVIEVAEGGVVLESLSGRFADPAAQALIDTLGSRLRGTVEGLASGLVDSIVREQLPTLVRTGLDGLVGSLADIPIRLDVGIEGAPVAELALGLVPESVSRRRRTGLALVLEGRLTQTGPVEAPAPVPGVPAVTSGEPPQGQDLALGLAVRLDLLNGLLHEVWRTGLLQITPTLPPELAAVVQQVRLDARLPPVVAPAAPGADFPMDAQLGDVRVFLTGPAGGEPDEYVLTLTAGISLEMDDAGALRLVTADAPVIAAELLHQAGQRPVLAPEALEILFGAAVWPGIRDALAGGLSLAIPAVAVDAAQISAAAPRVEALELRPGFGGRPAVIGGWLLLEGGLTSVVTLGPP
ncbi:hypothetical protein L6V77_04915 [Myxococcota bacterium]|nr:hypothetical protein [Myxococcota bacterium]